MKSELCGCGLRSKLQYTILLMLLCEILFVRPRLFFDQNPEIYESNRSQRTKQTTPIRTNESDPNNGSASANLSVAPLFYHVSPGSTGSRTLYHASCSAGFPSVHHKSFCISPTQGIAGIEDAVVDGVRAHFEVLRLYEMASQCLALRNKGKLNLDDSNAQTVTMCDTPLNEWADNLLHHLTRVLQSGLVGLFDTPYPYLAPQIMELTEKWRTNTVVGMTERDPTSWAKSRIKHGLLLCRSEYSSEGFGSSEFDVLGCIDRANQFNNGELHFWDAFWYRSHHEAADQDFLLRMERQMERHQNIYLPLAKYTPNFFGVKSASSDKQPGRVNEKDVTKDIMRLLWAESSFRQHHALTCRGRVNWQMNNDTFIEVYHLPKTCIQHTPAPGDQQVEIVPLIQARDTSC
jgi:hypothetical protein